MSESRRGAAEQPLERIVFSSARAAVGEWRCHPARPDFRDTGRAAFVTDATLFTVYNAGQRYTREAVHPDGDLCDWWSVDADTARAIARAVDARAPHDTDRPFRFEKGPAAAALY